MLFFIFDISFNIGIYKIVPPASCSATSYPESPLIVCFKPYFHPSFKHTEYRACLLVAWRLRCLHCWRTSRRSWVRFPHGVLLALGGRSSPDLQCSGGLSPG